MGNGTSFCTTECERHVETNANAQKPKDHPDGVWTLPPTQWQAESIAVIILRIGESDRLQPEIPAQFWRGILSFQSRTKV